MVRFSLVPLAPIFPYGIKFALRVFEGIFENVTPTKSEDMLYITGMLKQNKFP